MCLLGIFFFFKNKTAYELRISDGSSDVCSTDLPAATACMSDAFQSVYRKKQQRAERISAASPISLQNHRHMGAPYPYVCGQPHSSRRSGGGGYSPEGVAAR